MSPVPQSLPDDTVPLVEVQGISVGYRSTGSGRGIRAVDSVSFHLDPGEFVSIVGESGSGKSTTVQAILGLLPPTARLYQGAIELNGQAVSGWSDRRFARLRGPFVGYVPQDPGASLNPVKTIGAQLVDALRLHARLPRAVAQATAREKLALAGLTNLDELVGQYPHQLSGGMRQRVLIAIALANDPQFLIADEPTSALDVTVQRVILDHLDVLRKQLGLGVLLVTHDIGVAAERADRIIVMRRGAVVEHGISADVVNEPQHAYTRDLLDAALAHHRGRLTPRMTAPVKPGAVLSLVSISKSFSRVAARKGAADFRAVDGVSLRVERGSTHAIVGESGAGKSTLARIAAGLVRADSGEVVFDGTSISRLSRRDYRPFRRRIQLVYQNPYSSLDPRLNVAALIAEPLSTFGLRASARDRTQRIAELLAQVELDSGLARRRPSELSGGQRQRVAIARALAAEPELIVLDEAVSALDVLVQAQILRLLTNLQGELGLSYLFITHDLGVVRQIADDVSVMRGGRVLESGSAGTVLNTPQDPYTRSLVASIPVVAHQSGGNHPDPFDHHHH